MNSLRLWYRSEEVRMWLLCLPPGGGGAHQFRSWTDRLPLALGVAAVELPGHGARSAEPPRTDLDALCAELAADVVPLLGRPVLLYGHSMGAVIAHDLAQLLRAERGWRPAALVAAAGDPPDRPLPAGLDALSDADLTGLLRAWGGTTAELLDDPRYLAETLPLVRADLALVGGRAAREVPPLDCPVHVYLGARDTTVDARLAAEGWAGRTTAGHTVRTFPGGHFFPQQSPDEMLTALVEDADAAVGGRLLAAEGVAHG
ncbi:thioesterase II family protein [Streptomyces cinerochromogenes]|uniref:thioesterase II family protein n=1 Tax=Streptomyces cinerochromogenes TaxID=66422 RepID=UPI0033A3BD79